LVWVFALWVFPIAGCNEVTTPSTAPLTFSIRGWSAETAGYQQQLEGVQVCEGDTDDNCVFSDANGNFSLWLPVDQEIFYTLQKEGYDSSLFPDVIPEGGRTLQWFGMSTVEVIADVYERAMSPYPRLGTGEIYIETQPALAGATFELVGATGTPFYQVGRGDDITYRLDLDATTSRGAGGFLEVPPGSTVTVVFGGTAQSCLPGISGWPGDDKHSVRIPVREGYANTLEVNCSSAP